MKKDFIDFLAERNSIRKFDTSHRISKQEIEEILSLAAKAPSGNNTQPWKVVTVMNKEVQKQLVPLSFNQSQIEDAAAIFIVFGDPLEYDVDHLADYKARNEHLSPEEIEKFKEKMTKFYEMSPIDKGPEALKLDCGLFSMNLLSAIRAYGYDGAPMRGVNFAGIKELLSIPEDWLPILIIPFGKANEPGRPKVRKPVAEFTRFII